MGCTSDKGIGRGTYQPFSKFTCGGSGGNYGGFGGIGLSPTSEFDMECIYFLKLAEHMPYGLPEDPFFEGSGGGSFDQKSGGVGGGVIIMISEVFRTDGKISADGLSNSDMSSPNPAGAGAGGSIQLYYTVMSGKGNITADGGYSHTFGGEGGGGRIKMYFKRWGDNFFYGVHVKYWFGNYSINCGIRK